ncbi:MAG TPA: alkaline phosphatase family protein, partial [Bacteroidota bacterium]
GRSPRNFIGATFGDQLKLHTNFQAKVISVSNKDRAAILMGGKLADAAYWSEDSLFVTSTYYRSDLPDWVQSFNRSGWYRSYFGKEWKLLLPESEYRRIGPDDGVGESDYFGKGTRFPHRVDGGNPEKMTRGYTYALLTSPFGAEVLEQFAEEAVKAERLGQRGVTDLLCLGISSTDYVGHAFGPQSWEAMDMTVRMDRLLAKFLAFLDSTVGIANCVLVLTSDHGIAPIPELLTKARPSIDAGRVTEFQLLSPAAEALEAQYGALSSDSVWMRLVEGGNIYLEEKALVEKGLERDRAARIVQEAISALPFVAAAFTQSDLSQSAVSGDLAEACRYSYFPTRSGDVLVVLKPYYFPGDPRYPAGTTHGSPYSYDAHVPLLIAGPRIVPGTYYDRVSPADIAPTLSVLLGVEFPPRVQGRILSEAMKDREN